MNVVRAANGEVVREGEGEVGDCACVKVECEDGTRVCHDSLELNGVDEWLGQGGKLQWGVVEAVDVVPDCQRLADLKE